jgi:DNA replication protein DnaC
MGSAKAGRHPRGIDVQATLMTSQFPVNQWHEVIADATVADAILDRWVHNAYRLELKGEWLRKNTGASLEKQKPSDP